MEITGRITKDATLVKISAEKQVVNFSIAINDSYKAKGSSQIKEVITYINCDYWLSPNIVPYLKKGALVELFGRIGLNVYTNAEGKPLGSLTFHINSLKILVFAKKNTAELNTNPIANPTKEADDLPF